MSLRRISRRRLLLCCCCCCCCCTPRDPIPSTQTFSRTPRDPILSTQTFSRNPSRNPILSTQFFFSHYYHAIKWRICGHMNVSIHFTQSIKPWSEPNRIRALLQFKQTIKHPELNPWQSLSSREALYLTTQRMYSSTAAPQTARCFVTKFN